MKTCNKCGTTKPLDCFHTEVRRGRRVHKARCATCVQAEWRAYQSRQKGIATPEDMSFVFNDWRGPVNPGLGLRP